MGLEAVGQQGASIFDEMWLWISDEFSVHPFIFAAAVIVIISAFILYKAEVRNR